MSDTLSLDGTVITTPTLGSPSGIPTLTVPLSQQMSLVNKSIQQFDLTTDAPVTVDLSALDQANFLLIQTVGGKVTAGITSDLDPSRQKVPVDPLLIQFYQSGSISALDLTRQAGVETNVYVFIGEMG